MTAATNITSITQRLAAYDAEPVPIREVELLDLPEVIRLSEVEPKQIEWLWPGWLPKGMLTILGGFAGDGKSTLTLALAAAFSNGSPLPDGSRAPVTNTLLMLAEDDIEHVVTVRLADHNADRNKVFAFTGKSSDGQAPHTINLKTDVAKIRQLITNHDIGLLVIDPISSFMPGGDRNNEGDVRDALGPLLHMAEETGVAIIGIMHIGKSEGYSRSTQRLMGSSAFVAVARSVWMLAPFPEEKQEEGEPTMRVLGVEKSNYAVPPKALMYSRPHNEAIQFHGESSMSLDAVLTWKKSPEREKGSDVRDAACKFLYRFLAGGMKPALDVEAEGMKEGHTKRILRRAKEDMNIASRRIDNRWYWSLPLD